MKKKETKPKTSKALLAPEVHHALQVLGEGGLFAIPKRLAEIAEEPTPKEHIEKVNGFDYVRVGYIRRKLNEMFGLAWSTSTELMKDTDKGVVVKVKLEIRNPQSGQVIIVREQYGGQTYRRNVPYENTFKAACSDGLKKCASTLGIAQDVYEPAVEKNLDNQEKREEREESQAEKDERKAKPIEGKTVPDRKEEHLPGKDDGNPISTKEVAAIARLLQANENHRPAIRQFMKKEFGMETTVRLKWGQYRKLHAYIGTLNPENPPF